MLKNRGYAKPVLKKHYRPQYEALGNNYRVCAVYSPEPRAEVYCVKLNFSISKLVYSSKYHQ